MLVLAGLGIANFTINFWALIVLVVGIVPFILALRRSRQYVYLVIALAALVIGTVFLIRGADGGPGINPVLAIVISTLVTAFVWMVGRRTIEALSLPVRSLKDLIGKTGEAHTDVFAEGSVYVDGEEWSGRSVVFIPAGRAVKILGREGLILLVAPLDNAS
jgi:membrane-bound serine protease (ClpP class)